MPSCAGHEAPIRLVTGGDRRLTLLRGGLAAAALFAVWISGWPLAALLLASTAIAVSLLLVEWRQRSGTSRKLVVHPSGQATLDGHRAELMPTAWLSPHYAVLRLKTGRGGRRLLISASRQARGEYRKLLTWMRWQPWNSH